MKHAILVCLVPLAAAGCVFADVKHTSADGAVTEARLRRLWANTSLTIDPTTGTLSYSSQPQSEAVNKALDIATMALTSREPAPRLATPIHPDFSRGVGE